MNDEFFCSSQAITMELGVLPSFGDWRGDDGNESFGGGEEDEDMNLGDIEVLALNM